MSERVPLTADLKPPVLLRFRQVYTEWRNGRPYRFPVCCQAHYYFDVLRGRTSAARRGAIEFGPVDEYVPCALCVTRPSRWRLPRTLHGTVGVPRYVTWEQSCAAYGIDAETAARYVR